MPEVPFGGGDVDGTDISPKSVDAQSAVIGPDGTNQRRATTTDAEQTITVGTDAPDNQTAVNEAVARWHGHKTEIYLQDEPNTDLYIPPHVGSRTNNKNDSERWSLRIEGDPATPSNIRLNSAFVDCFQGIGLTLSGIKYTGDNPTADENANLSMFGCPGRVLVGSSIFSGADIGVVPYSSRVSLESSEFGSGIVDGTSPKHNGVISVNGCTGSVSGYIANVVSGVASIIDTTTTAGKGRGRINPNIGAGLVIDNDREQFTTSGPINQPRSERRISQAEYGDLGSSESVTVELTARERNNYAVGLTGCFTNGGDDTATARFGFDGVAQISAPSTAVDRSTVGLTTADNITTGDITINYVGTTNNDLTFSIDVGNPTSKSMNRWELYVDAKQAWYDNPISVSSVTVG